MFWKTDSHASKVIKCGLKWCGCLSSVRDFLHICLFFVDNTKNVMDWCQHLLRNCIINMSIYVFFYGYYLYLTPRGQGHLSLLLCCLTLSPYRTALLSQLLTHQPLWVPTSAYSLHGYMVVRKGLVFLISSLNWVHSYIFSNSRPGSSSISLPPHKQNVTGSIPGGNTNICNNGLYHFVP